METLAYLLDSAIRHNARVAPEGIACADRTGEISNARLASGIPVSRARLTEWTAASRPGSVVLVHAEPSRRFFSAILACHTAGLAVVPLSDTAVARDVVAIQQLCGAQYLIGATSVIEAAGNRLPGVAVLDFDDLPPVAGTATAAPADTHDRQGSAAVDREQLAFGVFTSGSTGRPKGIGFTQRQMRLLVTAIGDRLAYGREDVVHCGLPLSFDYGYYQILLSVVAGSELILSGNRPGAVLPRELARRNVTVLPVVPTLLRMYLVAARRGGVLPPLRLVTNTGERLPEQMQTMLADLHPAASLALMYGLSECKRVSIGLYPASRLPRADVGHALAGTEVTIEDENDDPAPPGQLGAIVVRGPHVSGIRLSAGDSRRHDGRDVLATGDIGRMDEDGLIYVEGRADQQVKINGVRAARGEIEQAAERIPGVVQACCAPDGVGTVTLWIIGTVSAEELYEGLREEIDAMKIPAVRRIVDRIPVNAHGKLSPTVPLPS